MPGADQVCAMCVLGRDSKPYCGTSLGSVRDGRVCDVFSVFSVRVCAVCVCVCTCARAMCVERGRNGREEDEDAGVLDQNKNPNKAYNKYK